MPSNDKRATQLPDKWRPSQRDELYAGSKGLTPKGISREVEDFRDYHIGHGSKWVDWSAAWRMWVRRAVDMREARERRENRAKEVWVGGIRIDNRH